jgi:recombination protein RecA
MAKRIPAKKKSNDNSSKPKLTEEQLEARKAATASISNLEKQFGKGIVMRLGSGPLKKEMETISTGSIELDKALGIGGLPCGRCVEILGPESGGKTTLALHVIANAQAQGYLCAFIDAEHALDLDYANNLGVNVDELLLSQPDYGEQALEVAEHFVSSGGIKIVVIDSVAALTPRAELEGEMGDVHVGLQARLMSQALRKLTATVSRNRAIVIFINQIRMKIGVKFGSPETTTGGNALKFYSSVRLDIRRIGSIKKGTAEEAVSLGSRTRVKVIKNKCSPPFRQAEFDIIYGKGISLSGEVLDIGVSQGVVEKSGAWYSYGEERIGQGRENAKQFLEDNPDIMNRIKKQISRLT